MSILSMIGNIVKAAIPFLVELGSKIFGRLGEAPSLDEKTPVVDVEQIGNALAELRAEVLEKSRPSIDNANESLKFYLDEQLFSLEDRAELLAKYEISSRSIERRMRDIRERLEQFWTERLNRKISLDDDRCRSILTLPSGAKKEADLAQFVNDVIHETLDEYAELVRKELTELYDDLQAEVSIKLKRLERTVGEYEELIQSIDTKDEDRLEQLKLRAALEIACCDAALKKVSE